MRTLILIAASGADAGQWQEDHIVGGGLRVVVVTPRAPNAARGVSAAAVLVTDAGRALPQYEALLADAMPAVHAQVLR